MSSNFHLKYLAKNILEILNFQALAIIKEITIFKRLFTKFFYVLID
ncbi:hypothetical protein CCS77_1156 [Campylobacter concisus]|uniref:Uncharacterized protein n=1 Tax=Campylobacter concisus TaxID=199 RepID=A0A2R4P0K6_9BACT|nr:hypothetical protein CCS77_1156 [Campylobacter concisus]